MQVFLPYADFDRSVECLDNKRLGKQRVECKQILLALKDSTYGWQNHPATRMFRGHEKALAEYGFKCCVEWTIRGFNDSLILFFDAYGSKNIVHPKWLGDERVHLSHQSNLLRKDYNFYNQYGWTVPDNLPYYWPVQ